MDALYADILTSNPDGAAASRVFEEEASRFARAVGAGNEVAVVVGEAMFGEAEVRYAGELRELARGRVPASLTLILSASRRSDTQKVASSSSSGQLIRSGWL